MNYALPKWIKKILPIFLFIIFNTLVLLPEVYFKHTSSTFFPSSRLDPDPIIGSLKLLFVRENADLFRIIAEIGIWVILLVWLSRLKRIWNYGKIILFILLVFILITEWYFQVSYKLYGEPPNIANDILLVKEVLPLFLRELGLNNILILMSVFLAFLGLLFFMYKLYAWGIKHLSQISDLTRIVNSLLLIGIMFSLQLGISFVFDKQKDQVFWKTLRWVTPSLLESMNEHDTLQIGERAVNYNQRIKDPLLDNPNIYVLFIESYGSVVQLLKEESPMYNTLVDSLDDELKKEGWYIASDYSKPPVIGGRSWLAFTSAMTGIPVKNHIYYNELLTNHYDYPHLIRFLKAHDYYTYRMKTMSNQKQSTNISYALADRFYAFDEWIKFDDIPYRGFRYDRLGGIPDQFAMNFFADSIRDSDKEPFLFFSINMSSHAPWHPAPPLVKDWQSLNTEKEAPSDYDQQKSQDESMLYYRSIEYVLKVMTEFVLKQIDNNSVVIFIGDHQPPGMTFLCDGIINEYAVPIHILCKNRSYNEYLLQNSFVPSMRLNTNKEVRMQHFELYDLIIDLLQEVHPND